MSAKLSVGRVRQTYRFIEKHRRQFSLQQMCRVLEVAPSGYYEWLKNPLSNRALEDARLHTHLGGIGPDEFEATLSSRRKGVH